MGKSRLEARKSGLGAGWERWILYLLPYKAHTCFICIFDDPFWGFFSLFFGLEGVFIFTLCFYSK